MAHPNNCTCMKCSGNRAKDDYSNTMLELDRKNKANGTKTSGSQAITNTFNFADDAAARVKQEEDMGINDND